MLDSRGFLRARYPSDIAGMLPLRLVGCYRWGDNVAYHPRIFARWLTVGLACLVWQLYLSSSTDDVAYVLVRSAGWSAYFVGAAALMLAALHVTTQRFLDLSLSLGSAVTDRGRRQYERWYEWSSKSWRQWTVGLIVALLATVALYVLQTVLDNTAVMVITIPSYIIVGLTGFFTGLGAYWVIACIVLCVFWGKRGMLRLYRWAPAYTPGVEELSRLVMHVLFGAVILSAVFLAPAIVATSSLDVTTLAPDTVSRIQTIRAILLGICGLTVIAVGVVPQEALSSAIRDQRHAAVRKLMHELERCKVDAERTQLETKLANVANSPTSTLGSGNVVQIVVAGVTALTPFLVTLLLLNDT